MFKGYYSTRKPDGSEVQFPTVEPIRLEQSGLSILAHQFVRLIGTDAAEANSDAGIIEATGHAAEKGDVIRFTSGTYSGRETKVVKTETDLIYLADNITPANTDAFSIYRHKYPLVGADGTIPVSATLTQTAIQFDEDGTDIEVHEDTGTPANSKPLPVKVLDSSGVEVGFATQTTLAALLTELQGKADLAETQPVSAASLPLPSGASTEAKQDSVITALGSLLTELQGKADLAETQPVSAASLPLPSGASTSANQSSIITALGSLLTELQGKADLAETQPVSAASLPLPAGAATEATLSAIEALLPASIGQKAKAASLAVTLASDEDPLAVTQSGTWSVRNQDGSGNALTSETIGSNQAQHVKTLGGAYADSARNDYSSVNVTTSAWTELIASTAAEAQGFMIFDSSGQTLELGIGAAASESRIFIIPPGGREGFVPIRIPAGSRVSVKAISALADQGEINLTLIG